MRTGFTRADRITHVLGGLEVALGFGFLAWGSTDDLAFGVLLVVLGITTLMRPWRDRALFNAGWWGGRTNVLLSFFEAHKRGMSCAEWLVAEAERDGVPVILGGGETE